MAHNANDFKQLQYAIYTILSGEYTRFDEPEYHLKYKADNKVLDSDIVRYQEMLTKIG